MSESYSINRLDYLILKTLYQNECKTRYTSATIAELMDENSDENGVCLIGKRMTIYKKLQKLVEHDYIKKGILDHKADTYYLTKKSIEIIESENKE